MVRTHLATPAKRGRKKARDAESNEIGGTQIRSEEDAAGYIIDGVVLIEIRRNQGNHHLSPSPLQVKSLLDRHELLPVRITFTELFLDAKTPTNLNRSLLKDYFDVFLDVLPRWKAARFWAPYVPWESFEDRQILPAPVLEHITLEGPSNFDISLVSQVLSMCWRASPLFNKFELVQFNEDTVSPKIQGNPYPSLPVRSLTALRLDCKITVWHCCDILAAASNLTECSFGNVTGSELYVGNIYENSVLQTLKIGINFEDHDVGNPTYLWRLFEFFRAPALRHLSVSCDDFWSTEHFIAFIRNSNCLLEALEFFMVKMTEPELFQILSHTPFLRILKVTGDSSQDPQPMMDKLIFHLTKCPQNTNLLCPHLEMFAVNDDAVEYLQDGALSKMLLSRMNGTHIGKFWFASNRDNLKHQFDIDNLEGIEGQLEILESIVIESSVESWKDWNRAVLKKLQERPPWQSSRSNDVASGQEII